MTRRPALSFRCLGIFVGISLALCGAAEAQLGPGSPSGTAGTSTPATQATPGSSSAAATGVQGVTNGLPIPVTVTNPSGSGGTVVQGTPGASPWPAVVAQYNATLPTVASGGTTYLQADASGRLILAPTSSVAVSSLPSLPAGSAAIGSVSVSNFPASQPVTNAGTFAVQNTAAVVGGNAAAVKVDGSAVTQPVSGTVTANLGTLNGAATAAGQSNTAAGTSATTAQGVQGVTGGVALPISAAALPLPTGSATAANQTTTQNNPGTSGAKADAVQGVTGGVPVPIQAALWYSEAVNSAVSAGNTYFGTTRTNTAAGTASSWAYWTVQIQTNAAGTLTIRNSVFDQTFSVSAGQVMTQRVPALGPSFATLFAPTSGAATITVFDSYSAN